jgi:hypothetical protein
MRLRCRRKFPLTERAARAKRKEKAAGLRGLRLRYTLPRSQTLPYRGGLGGGLGFGLEVGGYAVDDFV